MIGNPALNGSSLAGMRGATFLGNLLPAVMGAILVIGVVIFLFTFLLGAIEWISSGGDKGKMESAKSKLTNALIGIVILLGFFAIVSFLECFFGIGLRQITIGSFNVSLSGNAVCK